MSQLSDIAKTVRARANAKERRTFVAISGAPGSGKSTLAAALAEHLESAIVIPMDGFHYDNDVLDDMGLRQVKGSPDTFDIYGLWQLLIRMRAEERVAFPIFDRDADLARAGAGMVKPSHRIIIVEGNYLAINIAPWVILHQLWDFSIFVDTPAQELERRLIDRWTSYGLSLEEAREKALTNDIPNGRLVLENRRNADLTLKNFSL